MENSQDLNAIQSRTYAIGDNVTGFRDDEFVGAGEAAGMPQARVASE